MSEGRHQDGYDLDEDRKSARYKDDDEFEDDAPYSVIVPDQAACEQLYDDRVVLLGYDVVQYHFIPPYHQGGVAVRGQPEFAYNFEGYQFWFATAENRQRFMADPWRYAPAWGGFCSWGVARELPPQWPWAADFLGPPAGPQDGWLLVNNKTRLIFNIWASYSDLFARDLEANMKKAEERWISWFGSLQAGPFNTHCIGQGPHKNWCMHNGHPPSPWLGPLPECNQTVLGSNSRSKTPLAGSTTGLTEASTGSNVVVVVPFLLVVVSVLAMALMGARRSSSSFGWWRCLRDKKKSPKYDSVSTRADRSNQEEDRSDEHENEGIAMSSSSTSAMA